MAQPKALQRVPEVEKANRMRTEKANVMKTKRVKAKKASLIKVTKPDECWVEITKTDIFVVLDGVRIAKRGKPGTSQGKTWVSLEPGYEVFNTPDLSELVVVSSKAGFH